MRVVWIALVLGCSLPAGAQTRVTVSSGDVSRATPADVRRLSMRVPVPDSARRARAAISGDSAQRLAMHDFDWRGRVISVELDEDADRLYWDVKIVPDSAPRTVVRYRVDAGTAGILGIREFTGVALGPIRIRKP